jgi:cellulose synthase/poly-beta-1,6-N-acetylglucosamine synthase-like glycosyltransferase
MMLKLKIKIGITYVAFLGTLFTWLMFNIELINNIMIVLEPLSNFRVVRYPFELPFIELILYGLIINLMLYGSWAFILTRLSYLRRQQSFIPESKEVLSQLHDLPSPPELVILVPSYKEEPSVVLQTLLSAALMDYPQRRIVLLIDDPPDPKTSTDRKLLAGARQLPVEITNLLLPQDRKMKVACQSFQKRKVSGTLNIGEELLTLAKIYQGVAFWYEEQAEQYPVGDHSSRFFVEKILRIPARDYHLHAKNILSKILDEHTTENLTLLNREYKRLAKMFDVKVTSFERKQFVNLSHEANKAMNLNSYIGLIGSHWKSFRSRRKTYLQAMSRGQGDLHIPPADYVITLDADSLLLHDYALCLINEMEKPEYRRVAIAQTPYSAFPGASGALETIAGAQTDMQYIVHQGFTKHQATFWVGANALLRKKALDDIAFETEERGHRIKKYIQDRTVIEDTESSIDLVNNGWRLFNYPKRLAFSATPPDFGSLLIQRRRWANGGLIIFPKMMRYFMRSSDKLQKLPEWLLRTHYLTSMATTNLGLLIMILYGFNAVLLSPWLIGSVLIYFLIYALSLKEEGYRWRDLIRVWALNLLLIPVNLAGALKSIQQAITGKRMPFGRTPKVEHRTASPGWLVLFQVTLMLYCFLRGLIDLMANQWLNSGFAFLNGIILMYAITTFIGWRNAFEDLWLSLPQQIVFLGLVITNPIVGSARFSSKNSKI